MPYIIVYLCLSIEGAFESGPKDSSSVYGSKTSHYELSMRVEPRRLRFGTLSTPLVDNVHLRYAPRSPESTEW